MWVFQAQGAGANPAGRLCRAMAKSSSHLFVAQDLASASLAVRPNRGPNGWSREVDVSDVALSAPCPSVLAAKAASHFRNEACVDKPRYSRRSQTPELKVRILPRVHTKQEADPLGKGEQEWTLWC